MSSMTGAKKLKVGVFYKEHHERRRDAVHKDRQWIIRQKLNGKDRVSVLGWEKLDGISEGDALNKADFYRSNAKWNRNNPLELQKHLCLNDELASDKEEAKEIQTVDEVAERFIKHLTKLNRADSTIKEYRRQLNKYILPVIGKKRIIDVKDTSVIRIVEELSNTAPIMSNRVLATIKSMFSYATDTARVLKVNPVATIKKLAAEVAKERYLEREEVLILFKVLDEHGNRDTADILKLITLTGCRPGEIRGMRIQQIKREINGTWLDLSKVDTKGKKSRRAYLNTLACQIIDRRITDLGLEHYLFPAKTRFMRDDVLNNRVKAIQPAMQAAGVDPFSAHDLRRTTATNCSMLGFWAVAEDILGHAPQGVTRKHYDLYSREPEIKKALDGWCDVIEKGLAGHSADIIQINS